MRHRQIEAKKGWSFWFPRIRALFIGAAVLGIGAAVTLASWNDSEYVTASFRTSQFGIIGSPTGQSNSFSDHNNPDSPVAMVLPSNAAQLSPLNPVYSSFFVKSISNSVPGTVSLSGMTATSTPNALQTAMVYGVRMINASVPCNSENYRTATTAVIGALHNGADATIGAAALSTGATSAQALPADGQGVLHYCFMFALPGNAPSTLQGQSITGKWLFTGTSTS